MKVSVILTSIIFMFLEYYFCYMFTLTNDFYFPHIKELLFTSY